MLDAAQGARDAVDELGRGVRGSVRVGMLGRPGPGGPAGAGGDFRRRYPEVEMSLRVESGGSAGIAAALLSGEVDVGLLGVADTLNRELEGRELVRVSQVLAVPAEHPMARRRVVSVADLADEEFVDFPIGHAARAVTDRVFAAARIERRIAVEVDALDAAAGFVRHGVGVAIVPPFVVRGDDAVRMVKVKDESMEWSLHLATPRRRKPTAAVRALTGLVDAHLSHSKRPSPHDGEAPTGSPGRTWPWRKRRARVALTSWWYGTRTCAFALLSRGTVLVAWHAGLPSANIITGETYSE